MNMISLTGEVKHYLIGWDTLEDIYTMEELKRRVDHPTCAIPNIKIKKVKHPLTDQVEYVVYYYENYAYSYLNL